MLVGRRTIWYDVAGSSGENSVDQSVASSPDDAVGASSRSGSSSLTHTSISAGAFVSTWRSTFGVVALPVSHAVVMHCGAHSAGSFAGGQPDVGDDVTAERLAERLDLDVVVDAGLADLDLELDRPGSYADASMSNASSEDEPGPRLPPVLDRATVGIVAAVQSTCSSPQLVIAGDEEVPVFEHGRVGTASSAAPGSRASHGSDPDPDGSSPTGSKLHGAAIAEILVGPRLAIRCDDRRAASSSWTSSRSWTLWLALAWPRSPAPHRARRRRTAGRTRAAGRRHRQRVPSPQRPPVPPPRRTRGDAAGTCGGLPRAGARPSGSCGGWWCGALIVVRATPQRTVAPRVRCRVSGRHFHNPVLGAISANSWRNLRPDSAATGFTPAGRRSSGSCCMNRAHPARSSSAEASPG